MTTDGAPARGVRPGALAPPLELPLAGGGTFRLGDVAPASTSSPRKESTLSRSAPRTSSACARCALSGRSTRSRSPTASMPIGATSAGRPARRHRLQTERHEMTTFAATTNAPRSRIRIEAGAKRVRAYLGGEAVADTVRPVLVWEVPYYPTYYFPIADVRADVLEPDGGVAHSPSRGDGRTLSVRARTQEVPGAALRYEESPIEELRELIRLDWDSMDAWFEEDEQVFTHPRDPYTRVDILPSSRHVRVEVDGVTVAESTSPRLLFETGLPARYYLPKTHVRLDLLIPTDTVTHCPYKGQAEYWSVSAGDTVHEDLAWSYRTPLPESQKISGLIAFYNEKVDIYVDGALQQRPATKFS